MAETPRTLTALKALFPDNESQTIVPESVRDFLVSRFGELGVLYDNAAGGSAAGATPALMNAWKQEGSYEGNVTLDGANSKITVGTDGAYLVCVTGVATFDDTAHTGDMEIYKNGAALTGSSNVTLHPHETSAVYPFMLCGIFDLVATDYLQVYGWSTDAGATLSILYGTFWVKRVG